MKRVRWGILGSANIAKRAVIPGIKESASGEIVAIASRDIAKAKQTADEFEIPKAYGSYEELLADDSINAVYIPLPNHLHMEWTIKAAAAGKHILCEKPLALNTKDAKKMVDACNKAGVLLAEAVMYRYHPRYNMIRDIISSGEIGEVRGIHGTFTFFNPMASLSNFRYKKESGGSLYDVGVYPINAARMILGEEPQAATVHSFFSDSHDGVDMMDTGLLEFNGGVALSFDCGMMAAGRNTLEILGTKGRIEVPSAFLTSNDRFDNFFVITMRGREAIKKEIEVPLVNQYALQAEVVSKSILNNTPLPYPAEDSILNMKVVEACLQSAKERRRIQI